MNIQEVVLAIIKEQSQIIGEDLAKSRALYSGVVSFESSRIEDLSINNEGSSEVIDKLVNSYAEVFGEASVQVCLDVIRKYPSGDVATYLSEGLKSKLAG